MAIEADIQEALLARLAAFTISPPIPVAYPSVKYEPVNGKTYLAASFFVIPKQRLFIPSRAPHRRRGFLQVSIMSPSGAGELASRRIAGAVIAHFPEDLRLVKSSTTVRIRDEPSDGSAIDDGVWLNLPVTINWECLA